VVPPAVLLARERDRDVALLRESLDPNECCVVAVGEEPDPRRHTRRPGRTPASRSERSVGSSSPIVVGAPCPGYTFVSGGSVITRSRLRSICPRSPPGRSQRPVFPWNSTSPEKSARSLS